MFSRVETIHPLVVHFPIALGVLCLLFELSGQFVKKRQRDFDLLLLVLALLGTITAFLANFTGELAEHVYANNSQFATLIEQHANIALFVFWTFMALVIVGAVNLAQHRPVLRIIRLVLTVVLVGLIVVAAHRGSELVYQYGVGVQP